VHDGATQYTQATGLRALRERISGWYQQRFGVDVPARRIVVTAGASAALQLACLALIEAGDEVLMPDPSYPCNRHFVSAAEGNAMLIPTTAAERFQLSADKVRPPGAARHAACCWPRPPTPPAPRLHPDELRRIHERGAGHGGITLIDEIYLGLSYDDTFGHTALAIDDHVISINSFSKYFNMTGWRLGWMVVPEPWCPWSSAWRKTCSSAPAPCRKHAALACFEPESIAEYERRRAEFKARRDYFIPALQRHGPAVPVMPDGAFYAWADCTAGLPKNWACRAAGTSPSR
jgi:aspartate/methionine/tyrosine aminotransferase